jgi:hypothetical protein
MKRITVMVIVSIVSSIVASNALAQKYGIQAKVPFDFTVSNETLPAGTYTITSPGYGLVLIESSDSRISMVVRSSRNGNESTSGCKLVFNKYGNQYFLSQVLTPRVSSLNVRIVPSKLEKRVRLREASLKVNEQIQIAAR